MRNLRFLWKPWPLLCLFGCLVISACSTMKTSETAHPGLAYQLTVDLIANDEEQSLIAILSGLTTTEIKPVIMTIGNEFTTVHRMMVRFQVSDITALHAFRHRLSHSGLTVISLVEVVNP